MGKMIAGRIAEGLEMGNRDKSSWLLYGPGWLLLLYLVYAQAIPAFNYDLGVAMGTQEPASMVTEVGTAFWYGFALADLLIYIPLLALGLIAHQSDRQWGKIVLAAALGITVYWPVVCLSSIFSARDAMGWELGDPLAYWLVLPLIALWGAWGLWQLLRK